VRVSLIFLIHGLIIATWASRIPAFQAHLHLSPVVLGRSSMEMALIPTGWRFTLRGMRVESLFFLKIFGSPLLDSFRLADNPGMIARWLELK
jgi:hypothetical protein